MQAFAVFAAVLAAASASPQVFYNGINGLGYAGVPAGLGYGYGINGIHGVNGLAYSVASPAVAIAPAFSKTQYHAQDEFGQASFGHSEPTQSHAAVRDAAGGVRGTFSYISPEGKQLTTHYVADHNGYRVASNNLPVAQASLLVGPSPVQDTPEVVAAKVQHFAAVAEAQARSGRKKRGITYAGVPALTYGSSPFLHSTVLGAQGYGYSNQIVHAGAVAYSAPAVTYSAAPAVAYSNQIVHGAPAVTYSAAPAVAYSNQIVHAPAALTYAAPAVVASQALREATLTKVVNTPGHAVSYRVD